MICSGHATPADRDRSERWLRQCENCQRSFADSGICERATGPRPTVQGQCGKAPGLDSESFDEMMVAQETPRVNAKILTYKGNAKN